MNKAISWFKPGAKAHIAQMYHLSSILGRHGIAVEVIKTGRPGYVVYEDRYQLVAEPFSETRT